MRERERLKEGQNEKKGKEREEQSVPENEKNNMIIKKEIIIDINLI